jgi:copper chaperone CopZ
MSDEHRRITLAVSGMSCTGCSSRVQKALASVKGVTSAHVDLKGASAVVEVTTPGPTAEQLAEAVTNIGYDAKPVGE